MHMSDSPESIVREFLALWNDPQAEEIARFFAEEAVWVDGPNGVHRGAKAVVDELMRQLSIARGMWVEVDTLVADGGTVMVEWHGRFTMVARPSPARSWPRSRSTRTAGSSRCVRAST